MDEDESDYEPLHLTDSGIVKIARQIDYHLAWVRDLVDRIEGSDHPNAAAMKDALDDNQLTAFAWARHVVHRHLQHPERWETGDFGIRRAISGE